MHRRCADCQILSDYCPLVMTGYALSAANTLLQVVEVALPKQKKAQAVSEFKHSVIAHKRRARVQQNSECASWKFASNRALCGHCRSVIWLSNLTCAAPHHCPRNGRDEVKLRPLLPDTVAKYILHHDDLAASSSSESDDTDDSDYENGHPRFWTF
ncbi:F-box protein [Panicum miliaceum]|uniref:F-box protein n=1 Tax=Panicum miliaceum TaxID=4540 RepID=A0A3L6R6G5_PANMI|nr:F-box protein [Panicum miliaceum]